MDEQIVWQGHIEESEECPTLFIDGFEKYFTAYNYFKQGFLPYQGGYLQQPNTLIDTLQIIAREEARYQKELIDQQRQQQ